MEAEKIEKLVEHLQQAGFSEKQLIAGDKAASLSSKYYTPTFTSPVRIIPLPQHPEISKKRYEQIVSAIEIVKAQQTGLQIISRGQNIGYGSDAPYADNTVLLDLSAFDKIYQYNKSLSQISLEPGVTQQALYDYLIESGGEHWPDSTGAPTNASILGNYLERGFGHSPYAEHAEQIITMTCLIPWGIDTSPGIYSTAINGSLSAIAGRPHVVSIGPNFNGIFLQNNLGVVLNLTINLLPKPESFVAYFVEVKANQFNQFIDQCRYLKQHNVIQNASHTGNYIKTLQLLAAEYPAIINSYDPDKLKEKATLFGLSDWMMSGALYGTRHQVKANIKELKRHFKPLGLKPIFMGERKQGVLSFVNTIAQSTLIRKWIGNAILSEYAAPRFIASRLSMLKGFISLCELKKGKPSNYFLNTTYWRNLEKLEPNASNDPASDNVGCIWGSPCSPISGEDVAAVVKIINSQCLKFQLEPAISCTILNKRNIECVLSLSFNRDNPEEEIRALECYKNTMVECAKAGYLKYRLSTHSNQYFDHTLLGTDMPLLNLKAMLDPLNIIQPGKYKIVSGNFTGPSEANMKNVK